MINLTNSGGVVMGNVDTNGYCYEREEYYSKESNLGVIKIVFVIGITAFVAFLIFYGKQQTLAAYSVISYKTTVKVETARAYDSKDFKANGIIYTTFKTTVSGDREFTLKKSTYEKVFGKHRKCQCRILVMDLTSDLGDVRELIPVYKKLQEQNILESINTEALCKGSLKIGDEYTVKFGSGRNAAVCYVNVPVTSSMIACDYQFGDDNDKPEENDKQILEAYKVLMRMKNEEARSALSSISKQVTGSSFNVK